MDGVEVNPRTAFGNFGEHRAESVARVLREARIPGCEEDLLRLGRDAIVHLTICIFRRVADDEKLFELLILFPKVHITLP